MAKLNHVLRRLYLDENVNIELKEELPQNVVNGVRFIYKQFLKKKPGVILNDPANYDQETQVSLFLNATSNGPRQSFKTVLILCDTNKLSVWSECLMKWMLDFDEVAIDWPKPTSKKSMYLVTTDRLEAYCRREWDLAVFDDDSFLQYKLTPKEFKVGYKIFITDDDLKENLHKFSQIYKWLYPDKKIDVNHFRPDKHSIRDILQKRMWFDAFTIDILVRNASSLIQTSANTYREVPKEPESRKITRKNKDATGTKIKRSKRKLEEDNTDTVNKKVLVPSDHKEENGNIDISDSKIESNNDNDESKLDVESFIRDQEPLKMDDLIDMSDIDENMSHISMKMDVTEAKNGEAYNGSDSEASNVMKLNYSEDSVNSDDAYCLETQDNEVDNSNLKFKENTDANIEENETSVTDTNIKENEITNNNTNIATEKSDLKKLSLCNKVENGLIDSKSNSVDTHTEIVSKDKDNNDVEDDTKKISKADDLDSKWEEMALKKFKGSLLDRMF